MGRCILKSEYERFAFKPNSLKLVICYEPSPSKTMFFDLNPKGGKILDFQTPPAPPPADEFSNPDPGTQGWNTSARETLAVDLVNARHTSQLTWRHERLWVGITIGCKRKLAFVSTSFGLVIGGKYQTYLQKISIRESCLCKTSCSFALKREIQIRPQLNSLALDTSTKNIRIQAGDGAGILFSDPSLSFLPR